ncbi:MAG: hypothetical protein LAO79_18290 [Acidobacteriia bacterium]|nr:hypothetical protein [Terriglobia bacterium]
MQRSKIGAGIIICACVLAPLGCRAFGDEMYPHAFPRTGTVKPFENDRVTVWEVNWLKGVMQPVHRHRYDMAGVYLRFGQITVTGPDEPVPASPKPGPVFEIPRPYYQPKGVTHREVAFGGPNDPERLGIMCDLKDSTPQPFEVPPGMMTAFPREGAKDVLDNARVIEWDYTWKPHAPVARHVHDKDSIEVFLEGGTIKRTMAEGR